MFRGIIRDIGTIVDVTAYSNCFSIKTQNLFLSQGDSVACSGVCLTVISTMNDVFMVQVSQETIKVSNLNTWAMGKKINLEQAIRLSERVDGHLVQGHVDGTAKVLTISSQSLGCNELKLTCPRKLVKFIAEKGSLSLDGVSLTINSVVNQEFTVNILPYTWKTTTFQYNKIGDYLNLEIDMIARYLNQLVEAKYN